MKHMKPTPSLVPCVEWSPRGPCSAWLLFCHVCRAERVWDKEVDANTALATFEAGHAPCLLEWEKIKDAEWAKIKNARTP